MSFPILLHHLAAFLAILMACYALSKWGSPRTLYFTCYAISIAIYAVGALMEITASTTAAAVVACKIQYFGLPFAGPFFFLFSMDYANSPLRKRKIAIWLLIFPLACTLLVNGWPLTSLYYRDLTLSITAPVNHLMIVPGPVYPFALAYHALMLLAGTAVVTRYYLQNREKALRSMVVFLLAALPVLVVWALRAFQALQLWDLTPLALTLNGFILGFYMIRFRRFEWTTIDLNAAVQQMRDAFVLLDGEARYLNANAAAKRYFPKLEQAPPGLAARDIEGFPARMLNHSTNDYEFTLGSGEEQRYLRASRSPLTVDGREWGTIIMIYDNTENRHLLNELEQLATHDALTGLYNRGTFFRYAERDFDLSRRKHENGSVLMMDIDHFKLVNDEHGHQAGDKVLTAISDILRARLRHTDISGRYGGEELAVWLPDAASEGAAIIADVIRRAVEHMPFESAKGRFHVTVSIGVAGLEHNNHQNFDQLIAEADTALYRAKNEGRNRVCIYQPTDRSAGDAPPPLPRPSAHTPLKKPGRLPI